MILPSEPLPELLDAPGSSSQPKASSEPSAMHFSALSTSLCSATDWLVAPDSPRSFHSSTPISSTCPPLKTHAYRIPFYRHSNISHFPVVLYYSMLSLHHELFEGRTIFITSLLSEPMNEKWNCKSRTQNRKYKCMSTIYSVCINTEKGWMANILKFIFLFSSKVAWTTF